MKGISRFSYSVSWLVLLVLCTVVSADAQTPDELLDTGLTKYARELYNPALNDFKGARKAVPNDIEASILISLTLDKLNRYNEVADEFWQLLKREPDNANFNVGFAYSMASLGKHDKAIEYYSKAIQLEPSDPNLYYNRACSYDGKENFSSEAIE